MDAINNIITAAEGNNIPVLITNLLSTDLSSLMIRADENVKSESSNSEEEDSDDDTNVDDNSHDSSEDIEHNVCLTESDDEDGAKSSNSGVDKEEDVLEEIDISEILKCQKLGSESSKQGIDYSVTVEPDSNLTTDAHSIAGSSDCFDSHPVHFLSPRSNITPAIIERLEEELEFYEKVSLVFLLYDSDDLALQRLKAAYTAVHSGSITVLRLISEWASSERESSVDWANKFLEALCIIQNFEITQKLGYQTEELKIRFLPLNPETSLYVDLMRKALFHICESLNAMQLNQLSQLVRADMEGEGRIPSAYDTEYMEMNILHWMSQRYLKVGVPGTYGSADVKNMTKHLKVMGELKLVDYLESVARRCAQEGRQEESGFGDQNVHGCARKESGFSDQLSVHSSVSQGPSLSHSVTSQCQETSSISSSISDGYYMVNPHSVGYCVIINQKNFYKETDPVLKHMVYEDVLESRVGTDVDRDRLCEAFLNFGFAVKIWENLTHAEIINAVRISSTNLVKKEHSCFALCILSHGKKNAVYGVNSISVDVDDIEKLLHGKYCPNLMHKPKILLIQACQGLHKQSALPSDLGTDGAIYSKTCPEVSDMITFWATVPGYAAFRDRITGSWFVRTLWEQMLHRDSVGLEVINIFVNVIRRVCRKRAPVNGELKAMTPQFTTTFRKALVFPYHREARKAAARRMLERYMFDELIDQYIRRMLKGYAIVKKKRKLL